MSRAVLRFRRGVALALLVALADAPCIARADQGVTANGIALDADSIYFTEYSIDGAVLKMPKPP